MFKTISNFLIYRKNIRKHKAYLKSKFGLNVDYIYRLWTTINLTDVPEDIKYKYGNSLIKYELGKYYSLLEKELVHLDLNELINVYEIKPVDKDNFGITLGFSMYNNFKLFRNFIISLILIAGLITAATIIIL